MLRGATVSSSEIRRIVVARTLTRYYMYLQSPDNTMALDDSYAPLAFFGPPGVGKSALQALAAKDVALTLTEMLKRPIEVRRVTARTGNEEAKRITEEVLAGKVIPYMHLYVPQTSIWDLYGTPSPATEDWFNVGGVKVPINVWRLNPYMLPFLDYRQQLKDPKALLPALFVLDEFNMAQGQVLSALFQLTRSAELGMMKLNPLTTIVLLGNTPETNELAAQRLPAPLVDRMEVYVVGMPDVEGWRAYMDEVYGDRWDKRVGAFFMLNPKLFYVLSEKDETGAGISTPRGATRVAAQLWALRSMLAERLIGRSEYDRQVEHVVRASLVKEVADQLIGYLRATEVVDPLAYLNKPEGIQNLDKNVAAYVVLTASSVLARRYEESVVKGDAKGKEQAVRTAVKVMINGRKPLGEQAIAIVLTAFPTLARVELARRLKAEAPEVVSEVSKEMEELKEVEEVLSA